MKPYINQVGAYKKTRCSESSPSTLYQLLATKVGDTGDCLIEDGKGISSAKLFEASSSMAAGLAELGLKSGDRVAIWLPNRVAWLVSFFASAQLGAVSVSINTRFRSAEVEDLLCRSGSKVLIYWPGYKDIDFSGILEQCAPEALDKLEKLVLYSEEENSLPSVILGKPIVTYSELLAKSPVDTDKAKPDSPCIIFTTSGTTKLPKLVVHNQRSVLNHARNVSHQYGLTPEDRFLLFPPFCGVYGFCSSMAALTGATPLILSPTWNPLIYADLIDFWRVTHLSASNEAIAQLLQARPEGHPFKSIKFVASANINPAYTDISKQASTSGLKVVGLYGSSEVQALFSLSDRNGPAEVSGRAGGFPASAKVKVRARDPQSQKICNIGEAGELEIQATESMFVEYFNDPQATRDAFTDDGYFRTGDLAVTEEDGSFTFIARMGDTLRLGGFLVNPVEIEELIQQHRAIKSCQIVGARTPSGIKPVAFVIARPNTKVNSSDVIAYAADRLAKFKVPVKVFIVEDFPTTPSANGSKVQKNKLRELAESELAATSN